MEPTPRVATALTRIKSLFLTAPSARYSLAEAARNSGTNDDLCAAILLALEDVRFVRRDGAGAYYRVSLPDGMD